MSHVRDYLSQACEILNRLDEAAIETLLRGLLEVRSGGGRLFILGVGGSAANASHAVNDFRKIAGFEAYTPTDNVSELSARVNDEGWETVFVEWLKTSRLGAKDGILVFSVGGGNEEKGISRNIVEALRFARGRRAKVFGIVGRDGGFTATVADACVTVPTVSKGAVTAHTEAFQAVLWHLIVSHPEMKQQEMKWESAH